MILENVWDQVLCEETQGINGGASDLWSFVLKTLGDENVHNWVLKVLFELVVTPL